MSPRVLTENEVDPASDALDEAMTEVEEREARARFAPTLNVGDLTDGGVVNGARLTPMENGRPVAKGRPAARRAWMWNGSESTLPLAWNPDGTIHDNARRYLLKRYCLCCKTGGFRGPRCRNCALRNCDRCAGGTDTTKVHKLENGKTIYGWIIPNFYVRKEDVPFPMRFYGPLDCFIPTCERRDGRGFQTDEDRRMHESTRHRMEYRVRQDAQAATKADEVVSLQARVDKLTELLLQGGNGASTRSPKPRGRKPQAQKSAVEQS